MLVLISIFEKNKTTMSILSDLTVYAKYARFVPELNRRETFHEIVDNYLLMLKEKYPQLHNDIDKWGKFIHEKKVLPSMRAFQFKGKPIFKSNSKIYNCCYLPIDHYKAFPETMFLLLNGSGVGFSVQKRHVNKLPKIKKVDVPENKFLVVDTIEGWADAIKVLVKYYFGLSDFKPVFDFQDIRKKGSPLSSGGKAPGAKPLITVIEKLSSIFDGKANGERLSPIEVHDIICHIADGVLAGGIRRSALISLFDIDEDAMLTCKSGAWWEKNPQRGRANNSVVLHREYTTREQFEDVLLATQLSYAGEPGIFWTNDYDLGTNPCCFVGSTKILTSEGYREIKDCVGDVLLVNKDGEVVNGVVWSNGVKKTITLTLSNGVTIRCTDDHRFMLHNGSEDFARNLYGRQLKPFCKSIEEVAPFVSVVRIDVGDYEEVFDFSLDDNTHWGVVEGVIAHNCEISLRPNSFCNLTTVNGSTVESQKDFTERAKAATFFGTLQAGFTDFHYLRPIWKKNTQEDSLLGVSVTGLADSRFDSIDFAKTAKTLKSFNAELAKKIGINPAARITCCKPEGTSSLVLGTSSGVHAWHDKFYLRRMRFAPTETVAAYFTKNHPQLMEVIDSATVCITIPVKAPEGAITRQDETLQTALKRVSRINTEWIACGHRRGKNTHNCSVTISVKDGEWSELADYMWNERDTYTGISLLPYDGGTYRFAPFESISKEEYEKRMQNFPTIDFSKIVEFEDETDLKGEVACSGGACEIV